MWVGYHLGKVQHVIASGPKTTTAQFRVSLPTHKGGEVTVQMEQLRPFNPSAVSIAIYRFRNTVKAKSRLKNGERDLKKLFSSVQACVANGSKSKSSQGGVDASTLHDAAHSVLQIKPFSKADAGSVFLSMLYPNADVADLASSAALSSGGATFVTETVFCFH